MHASWRGERGAVVNAGLSGASPRLPVDGGARYRARLSGHTKGNSHDRFLCAHQSRTCRRSTSCSRRCGLPYKEHFVDVWKGDQYNPEFLKINPNSKIPAIVDHDGPGGKPYTVIESGAILLYLAEKTGNFLPKDMAKKYEVIQWLMIQLTGVGPMFGQWTHFKLFAPKTGNDYSLTRYTTELKRLYEVLEKRLGQAPYLGGEEYSIADIATFPWTRNHDAQGVKWEDHPNLARWFKAIEERPAVKAALAKVARDQVEPRNRDRRPEGSLLRPRPLRAGLTDAEVAAAEGFLDLKDKAAIVTGSSSDGGIGSECAKILASRGCNVIVNYATHQAGAEKVAADCVAAGSRPSPSVPMSPRTPTVSGWSRRRSSASAGSMSWSTMPRSPSRSRSGAWTFWMPTSSSACSRSI